MMKKLVFLIILTVFSFDANAGCDDSIGDGEVLLLHPMILRVGKTTMLKKNGNEKKEEELQRKKTLFAV